MNASPKNYSTIKPVRVIKNVSRNYGQRHAVVANCVSTDGIACNEVWFGFNAISEVAEFVKQHAA